MVELGWWILLALEAVFLLYVMVATWAVFRSRSWEPPQKLRMPDHIDLTEAVAQAIRTGRWRSPEGEEK